MDFDRESRNVSEEANILAIARRPNCMKVLLFLYQNRKNEKLYYIQEIADELDMCEATVSCNLYKLNDAGLVEMVESSVDKRLRFWKIASEELVEEALKRYKIFVGFKLARLIPYSKVTTEKLKQDKRFLESCEEHGLSVEDGILAVENCSKIGVEKVGYPVNTTYLWRKEQGYDPPNEPPSKQVNLEKVREAIG